MGEDSKVNCYIAMAYFELLCNVHGLGTTIMRYSAEVLNELAPAARRMLNIPEDHYLGLIVGFGYPESAMPAVSRKTAAERSTAIWKGKRNNQFSRIITNKKRRVHTLRFKIVLKSEKFISVYQTKVE